MNNPKSVIVHVKSKNPNNSEKKLFKQKMKIFFTLIHVFLCLDFGFIDYKSPKIKILSKLGVIVLSLCVGSSCIVVLLKSEPNYSNIWYFIFLLQYYLFIWILMNAPENGTFCFYQIELQNFDEQIGIDSSSYKMDTKLIFYWTLISLTDILLSTPYYILGGDFVRSIFQKSLFYIPLLSYHLPMIVLFFIFYSLYYRLENLKIFIQNRRISILRAHQLYRFLIDTIENVMKTFRYINLVTILFDIPGIMTSMYMLLKRIRENNEVNFTIFAQYLPLISLVYVKIAPTVAASWLSQEAKNIQTVVHNRLLEDGLTEGSDVHQSIHMGRFIGYIEARPLKFYMLSIIPMDASLLVIVLDYSITYLIVIIQLTHIY